MIWGTYLGFEVELNVMALVLVVNERISVDSESMHVAESIRRTSIRMHNSNLNHIRNKVTALKMRTWWRDSGEREKKSHPDAGEARLFLGSFFKLLFTSMNFKASFTKNTSKAWTTVTLNITSYQESCFRPYPSFLPLCRTWEQSLLHLYRSLSFLFLLQQSRILQTLGSSCLPHWISWPTPELEWINEEVSVYFGVFGDFFGASEGSMGASSSCMHDSLGDSFSVECCRLLKQLHIHNHWPSSS